MIQTIFKRVLQIIPMLFVISLVSFALVQLAPGDPISSFVTPNMNPDDVERIRQNLGLDQPIYVQYFKWLGNVFQGNFGYSLINNQPVLGQIIERLPATIGLMGTALFFTLLLSIPLGLLAAAYEDTKLDRVLNAISYVGISIPIFWFAMILIDIFAIRLHWLPSLGMRTIGVESFWDIAKHAILPVTALTFQGCASYYRYVRSNTINQLKEEYVLFGYAKGLSKAQIMRDHVLKKFVASSYHASRYVLATNHHWSLYHRKRIFLAGYGLSWNQRDFPTGLSNDYGHHNVLCLVTNYW